MTKREVEIKNQKNRGRLVTAVFIFVAFYSGWFLGHQDLEFQEGKLVPQILNKDGNQTQVDFSPFWKTWDVIVKDYDGTLDYKKMVEGAIRGMVTSVGDPYTVYMSTDETKEFENDISGTISGIGAEVGIKNDKLTVIAPLDNSPAKNAGLKSGDLILQIDGEDTVKMSLGEAVSKIRGKEGTKVKLHIQRDTERKDYEITRAKVEIKSVRWEIKEGNIGYIELSSFDENSAAKIKEAVSDLNGKGAKGIILDLRDNPGGLLDAAVSITSEFLKDGVVLIEKNKAGTINESFKTSGNGKLTDTKIPIAVLTNNGSASASEIVAGALQDSKRATLIGEKTFGKGSVQQIEEISGGSALRITIAHWFTPSGKTIDKEGLKPDVEVKLTENDLKNEKDPQLDKAIEFIKNKI